MLKIVMRTILLVLMFVKTQTVASITQSASTLSSYSTLEQSVSYTLDFTISGGSILSGSYVTLIFQNRYQITSGTLSDCKATNNQAVAATSVTCSVFYNSGSDSYQIRFNDIFPTSGTYTYLSLKFIIDNPYAATVQTIGVNIYNNAGNLAGIGSSFITYIASTLSGCTVSSSSQITGQPSTHTYTFTPSRTLFANSYLLLKMPTWYQTQSSMSSSFLTCNGISGSDQTILPCGIDTASNQEIINITGFVTTDRSVLTTISIQIATLKNPWSFQPFGPINFEILKGSFLTQKCQNTYHTVSQPNELSLLRFVVITQTISKVNTDVRLFIQHINPFPDTNNRIKIQFPESLSLTYSGTSVIDSQSSTHITFSNIIGAAISSFTIITPPSTRPYQLTVSSYVVASGIHYKIDQESLTFQNAVGQITAATVTPSNLFVNEITTYELNFTITNNLISGSFIDIIFPNDIVIDTASSICSLSTIGHTCSIVSTTNIKIDITSAVVGGTLISATITSIKNANQAKTTDSFEIRTYYDSQYDSLVDSVQTGVTVTMIANVLVSGITYPLSYQTYDLTTYQFAAELNDPIPAGGSIEIHFPEATSLQTPNIVFASFPIGSCLVIQSSENILQINGCFTSQMTQLNVTFDISNVRNPPSFKPTQSFKLYFKGISSTINYMQSGIDITMNSAVQISSAEITLNTYEVAQNAIYNIDVDQAIDIHQLGDYLILQIPNLMTLPTTPSCSLVAGPTITCSRLSNNQLKIRYDTAPTGTDIIFNLDQLTNYYIGDEPITFKFYVFDSQNYLMEQFLTEQVTYQQSILTAVTVNNDDNIALGEASNITLSITNDFSLYNSLDTLKTKMVIQIPTGFTANGDCVSTHGTCSLVGNQYEIINIGKTLINVNITLRSIIIGYFDPVSESFKLTYTYDNFNVSIKDSGVTVSPYCTSPCQRCDGTKIACQSCLPAPNTLIYYDPDILQCRSSCVNGKYPDDFNQCTPCVSPCDYCLDQQNCTKCVADTWLYDYQCLLICPDTYYNDSSGLCLQCADPCDLCNSLTSCKTCKTLYITGDQCVTDDNCPVQTYAESDSMSCQPCDFPCKQCSLQANNCTTCQTGYLYYDHNCVPNCPSGMYQSSIYCFYCVAPCDTCNSSSYCKSCAIGYLTDGQCVDVDDCPAGTYPNDTDNKCRNCPTGCTQCLNSTYCTECNTAVYIFYDFTCITQCPLGTYKSSNACLQCQSPCQNCQISATNCLSCQSPLLYYANACYNTCPDGSYSNVNICSSCLSICQTCSDGSTCDTCQGSLYFQTDSCVSTCSKGFYGQPSSNNCQPCQAPCSECTGSANFCLKCISPQLQYQNACVNQCPTTYFEVNGSCITCSNCVRCLDANTCLQCEPTFYQYNGVCYTTCPDEAPIIDQSTNTCGSCNQQCLNCEGTAKNCTECYSGTFLYKGSCLAQCPLGFIEDFATGTCAEPLIGNIIYFPFTFTFLFFFIVTIVSRCMFPQTQTISALASTVSLCQFGSWALLTFILTQDYSLDETVINLGLYLGLSIICLSIGVGIAYNISFCKQYDSDRGWLTWREYDKSCIYANRIIVGFSILTFRFFRFLYSRLFNRIFLTIYIADGGRFLSTMSKLTIGSLILFTLPMLGGSGFILYKKQIFDQTFFCAIDTLILGFITACLLTIDSFTKGQDFFQKIRNDLPFIKYRDMMNDESFHQSLLSHQEFQEPKRRTQSQIADNKQKQQIFRKITFIDNNKFGHLNVLEDQKQDDAHSLPQYNQLKNYAQYDPYNKSDADRVIDDLYFQENQRKRRQQQEEKQRLRLQRLKQQQEAQRKRLQQQERRRRLMQQDEQQRVNLQFPDLIAIDKVQGKDKKGKDRKNPLDLLSKSKKMDDKQINDKALKKLEQIGKKNGIDPEFMKDTFGVQRNHNPQLLNQIIDKHNHVKRQSVKQLFNEENNQEVIQQLFGKNSKMNPQKLRQIMNDPDAPMLIMNLANKQNGRLSPEMAKQLLDKDSKYNKEFTKQLLSDDNGMDHQKLQSLLKDAKGKGKDSPLKALKKIGGQNLENKQMLNNMLGQQSKLDPQIFTKVANDLSIKAIQNLFTNKSHNNDLITQKILNNKKINLKDLSPILEDQQLLQQLANCLDKDDPNLQQNLINLFKNAEDIDPQKLKQMLADPVIRKKLLGKPIDPDFLTALLKKDANTDFKLLSKTLLQMPDDKIQETFKFDPQKNVDFKNVANLFQHNSKSDPKLISKILEPDMVKQLYYKGNDTKMLNKLVQKGNQFDPEVIKGVYGKQNNNFFDTHTDNMMSFNGQKNQAIDEKYRGQKDYSLGFQKHKSQVNMSRTAGGMMNFLTPIIPRNNTNAHIKSKMKKSDDQQWSSDAGDQDMDDDGQIRQQDFKGFAQKKKKKLKRVKKKASDIRLPAEQIYLQRIEAPHENAIRKASIRKKKKKSNVPGVMDEDNDIFDMDF